VFVHCFFIWNISVSQSVLLLAITRQHIPAGIMAPSGGRRKANSRGGSSSGTKQGKVFALDPACVKVCVRGRPLLPRELASNAKKCVRFSDDCKEVTIGRDRKYTFDYAFGEHTPQASIFREVIQPLVDGCFQGFNATVLAYGQTGSGKTHTMGSGSNDRVLPEDLGVIPRVITRMFEMVASFCASFCLLIFWLVCGIRLRNARKSLK
jgi:hypothetical protein